MEVSEEVVGVMDASNGETMVSSVISGDEMEKKAQSKSG